ncbi:TetR/AcrR family transcriptional regulator [Nocardioides donggukensis]|uniref:TetR/AcrR family transcriptional regulator n=1 Tax=Nocardioides donggukensis TaxID=2774019 RepID=A0A927KAJ8_9ACTN|nr:TetR/AcrR family transcriptional regulator [Nocardioides donggukensis]MBD8870776.1 TetR/AcrR family transcriptional regulator [Nocardioides donggukensis]
MQSRRTQAERSSESRKKLVDATVELLASGGYSAASFVAIGELAGLSRGMVTHYFGTKEQCIKDVVQSVQDSSRAALASFGDLEGVEKLETIVRLYLREGSIYSKYARALYAVQVEAMTGTPSLRDDVAISNRWIRTLLVETIIEARDSGDAAQDVNPDEAAFVIEGTLRGVLLQVLVDPDVQRKEITEATWTAVRRILSIR